jgi:hypothetical protein
MDAMIRIAITEAAFEVIADKLPFGSTMVEPKATSDGWRFLWLEERDLDRLDALRQQGEGYSEVIMRLAQIEASRRG